MREVTLDRVLTEGDDTTLRTQFYEYADGVKSSTPVPLAGHSGNLYWRWRGVSLTFTEETATVDGVEDTSEFSFPTGIPGSGWLEFYFKDVDGASKAYSGEERFVVQVRASGSGE
jgi:hypothetical protein